ncbi:MAG: alpha/beta fold hydrolase [Oscillochloridaceae bacterium umkhey_bin13]
MHLTPGSFAGAPIGHSMGGLSAAVVAAEAPHLIRGAMLEDPALLSAEEWATPLHTTWPIDHAADRERSLEELIARGKIANPRWPDAIFPPWAQAKREASLKVFDWFALAAPDVDTIMAEIGVPTLLVTGDPDQGVIVTPAQAAAFQALNPLVRVAHVPGAGHCLRYEQPATIAKLARDFLATCFG